MLTNVVKEERKSNEVEDRKMEREEEEDVEGQVEAKNRGALKLTETNLGW